MGNERRCETKKYPFRANIKSSQLRELFIGSIIFGVADYATPFFMLSKKETPSLYPVTLLSAKKTIERIDLMSHSYFTRKLLNIKDKNITFPDDYLEEVKLNGITSFIFKGILSYQPTHCQKCGTLFDSKFKQHGFKTSRIVIPKVSLHDTYLELKKQRYYCGHCQSTFTLNTSIA